MEMNELTRSLDRVEELIHQESIRGALTQLNIAYNHSLTAVKLINDQAALLTKQQLKINELSERMEYWQKRSESAETEIDELDDQEPVGTCKVWNPDGSGEHKELWGIENLTHGQQVYARPVPAKSVIPVFSSNTLFDAIAHGDDDHRAWLKTALDSFFDGKPVAKIGE